MKLKFLLPHLLFFAILLLPFQAAAETVKPLNPDCDACPVVVSYGGDEAKEILGPGGQSLMLELDTLPRKKSIKIDLDGSVKPGPEASNDPNYDLLVFLYPHLIVINSIKDGSSIKIVTDFQNLKVFKTPDKWHPELQITSANEIEISQSDSLALAWMKVGSSTIYEHVNGTLDHAEWNNNFRKFLLNVLKSAIRDGV